MERLRIFDTTLRDGEQSPGCSMTPDEKLRMALQLERLGVDVIEAGFAISSPGEIESIQAIARAVRGPAIASLARSRKADIDACREALRPAARARCHTFIATSDIHLKYKLRMSREEVLRSAVDAVRYARENFDEVEFSAEDATRSDLAYLAEIAQAVAEAGADVINLPDTVGYIMPDEYARVFESVRARAPRPVLSAHCHNDLGMAVANSLAAVRAGARQIECTVNGIGERAGNASLEEIVMSVAVRRDRFGVECGVRTREIWPSSRLLTEITGVAVQPNKAIVGRNAFAHEAGIHQDGVLKNALTYEIMTPQSVGLPENSIVLGKHSGRHALQKRCAELGHALDPETLERVYRQFKVLADRKKVITDDDLKRMVQHDRRVA